MEAWKTQQQAHSARCSVSFTFGTMHSRQRIRQNFTQFGSDGGGWNSHAAKDTQATKANEYSSYGIRIGENHTLPTPQNLPQWFVIENDVLHRSTFGCIILFSIILGFAANRQLHLDKIQRQIWFRWWEAPCTLPICQAERMVCRKCASAIENASVTRWAAKGQLASNPVMEFQAMPASWEL